MNMIEELYYGNIQPQTDNSELSAKLKKQLRNVVQAEGELSQKLADDEKALLKKYTEVYNEFCCISCADAFITGFRTATRILFDAFSKPN